MLKKFTVLTRSLGLGLIISVAIFMTGCATTPSGPSETITQSFAEIDQLLESKKLTDARYQHVAGHEHLKINLALRHKLATYVQLQNLTDKKAFVSNILKESWKIGVDAIELYLTRMSKDDLQMIIEAHPEWANVNSTTTESGDLITAYRDAAQQQLHLDLDTINAFTDEQKLDNYWDEFIADIDESIMTKGRLTRQIMTAPFVPVIKLWIAYHEKIDYRGPRKADFDNQEVYYPLADANIPSGMSSEKWELLQRFSPVLVQQTDPSAKYPQRADHFGAISLEGNALDQAIPKVDIDQPALYAYIDEKIIQGVPTKQLVYAFWYTEHPQLSRIDFEAGPMEGWTVRVSLNQANEPMLFESVSNCGCYYKVFPTDKLEAMSRKTYGYKLADKNFYIENHLDDRYDAIVPEVISGINSQSRNIALYYSAGHHQLLTIDPVSEIKPAHSTINKTYSLHSYDELESLPFKNKVASLFDTDGLVRGAHRLESTILTPSGLYHAGHPRQRETQMIYFDDAEFDDPKLLETYLRLPPKAFAAETLLAKPLDNNFNTP
jgi:hypothetical protein